MKWPRHSGPTSRLALSPLTSPGLTWSAPPTGPEGTAQALPACTIFRVLAERYAPLPHACYLSLEALTLPFSPQDHHCLAHISQGAKRSPQTKGKKKSFLSECFCVSFALVFGLSISSQTPNAGVFLPLSTLRMYLGQNLVVEEKDAQSWHLGCCWDEWQLIPLHPWAPLSV